MCFENRVLRRIFGLKRNELQKQQLQNLYSSPSIIIMIKSRRIRWAEHAALMGEKRNVYMIFVEMIEVTTRKTKM
jgi:GTPase SAR1 family protein